MSLCSATEVAYYTRPSIDKIVRHSPPSALTDNQPYALISAEATGIARATFFTDEEGYAEHAKLPTCRNVTRHAI